MPERHTTMRRPLLLLAAAALALAPAFADARPGGGSSMGSRGSRTYSAPPPTSTAPSPARPMERSWTEPSRPNYAQPARPPIGQPNPAGGFFSRSPFMAGLMGGLIGAGLGGLLFGHGLFGGFTGMASFLGFLLQIGLIAGLVWLVLRLVRGARPQARPAYAGMARMAEDGGQGPRPLPAGGGAAPSSAIQLAPADFEAFERTLKTVNDAWSRQDERAMRAVATPEMIHWFGQELAELNRRGLRNETRDTVLEQGDLAEAWREGGRDYATVAMRFAQVDVTRRISDGAVVEGDPDRPTRATELWTFVRERGGDWQLSAIQQTVPA